MFRPMITLLLLMLASVGSAEQIKFERVFSGLKLQQPVDLRFAPGDDKHLYLVQRTGKILKIDRRTDGSRFSVFVDITKKITSKSSEQGLLGLAFDPRYSENGQYYLYYTDLNGHVTISRFFSDGRSLQRLLKVRQPYGNHNGGAIVFGRDGRLYLGVGDGGWAGDPHNHGQNKRTLLGSIVRLDVRKPGKPKPEVFAYGLRNPWRMSFDSQTGELWAADVGQNKYEEVHIIKQGGNYGWNILEGSHCFRPATGCRKRGLELPVFEYSHSEGQSITGGHVYRGRSIPELVGWYVVGDFVSGRIWKVKKTPSGRGVGEELFDTRYMISTFGVDQEKELYFVAYNRGEIYKFVRK